MIEGIRFDMPSHELKLAVTARIEFHDEQIKLYDEQLRSLSAIMPEETQPEIGRAASVPQKLARVVGPADPRAHIRQLLRNHQTRRAYFVFLLEHLIPNEIYRLNDQDLMRLELLS
jgi:hypothetical protein